jgi:hypothetical protein
VHLPLGLLSRPFGESMRMAQVADGILHCHCVIIHGRLAMNRRCFILLFLACPFAVPFVVSAQPVDSAAAKSVASLPVEARQFDFLLGQWDLEVCPKVSGLVAMIHGTPRLVGTWKGTRMADGLGIEDELRIVDASGNPITLNRTTRTYLQDEGHWKISGFDVQRTRRSEATGQWRDGQMHQEGHFTDADGKPTLTRTRYYDISAAGFHMQQDRSTDDGQSWEEGSLIIDARRAAATTTP